MNFQKKIKKNFVVILKNTTFALVINSNNKKN